MAITDIHEEVVKTAKSNLLSATEKGNDSIRCVAERAAAKVGDLLLPLEDEEPFDIIYELVEQMTSTSPHTRAYGRRNLPNIPLPHGTCGLREGQTSSTYVGDRSSDKIPRSIVLLLSDLSTQASFQ